MLLNNFSVRIVGGTEVAGGYVELAHGRQYSIVLSNKNATRCDAKVTIDGKTIGEFRVNAHSSITLERPVHDSGKFTFYKSGSIEAEQAQLDEASAELGLVNVVFTPEHQATYSVTYSTYNPRPITTTDTWSNTGNDYPIAMAAVASPVTRGLSSGGTGLSGKSRQEFVETNALNHDYLRQTTINLRLVCREDNGPRPLTAFSTPVPPRVD